MDIYKSLQIPPPTKGRWGARAQTPDKEFLQLWKNKFKEFILEEVKNGRYPSGVEIGKHFSISHIWNLVKTSELYNELGIAPYRERSKRRLTNPLIF